MKKLQANYIPRAARRRSTGTTFSSLYEESTQRDNSSTHQLPEEPVRSAPAVVEVFVYKREWWQSVQEDVQRLLNRSSVEYRRTSYHVKVYFPGCSEIWLLLGQVRSLGSSQFISMLASLFCWKRDCFIPCINQQIATWSIVYCIVLYRCIIFTQIFGNKNNKVKVEQD